ncbi:MAG: hypothetical protein K8S27_11020 [Candidatus Omnitrophica bacterium]|nr:hypothetical protein [Candidatus Omnitrophota bacterium]
MNNLNLNLEKEKFLPGEVVKGEAHWYYEMLLKSMEVRLFWYTCGKGNEDVALIHANRIDLPPQQGCRGFSFLLPDSPYSFSGKLVSLVWAVEILVDGGKDCLRENIVVAPDREEINILHTKSIP